jgi:hypothetical protein
MNASTHDSEAANTHLEKIKQHLLSGKEITKLQALKTFGCWNTGDVVYKLRNQGLPIETEMRQEGRRKYAVYRICRSLKQLSLF